MLVKGRGMRGRMIWLELACADGGGCWARGGRGGLIFLVRARTTRTRTRAPLTTPSSHFLPTARQPFVMITVDVACPFSSSYVIVVPTGMLVQLRLVDALGGRVARV